jgi:hypothetical protein
MPLLPGTGMDAVGSLRARLAAGVPSGEWISGEVEAEMLRGVGS